MQQSKTEEAIRFHRRINLGEHPRYRAAPSLPELPLLRGCLPTRNNTASGSDSSLSPRDQERERERLLWSDAEDVCGLILADPWEGEVSSAKVRGLGGIHVRTIHGRCSSRWQMSPGIPPGTALLLEGRRHPLTRDSAVSVTRGREPNLIPSHPCSRRPWRPFNYWRDRARVSWSRII